MIVEIGENLNEDLKNLIVTDADGKNVLDVSKLKTEADVQRVLTAKQHIDQELTNLKNKYKRS